MRVSMNTALSGNGRVDDIESHPQGERFGGRTLQRQAARSPRRPNQSREAGDSVLAKTEVRGLTKFVKITEDVRKFAAQQQIAEQDALQVGLEQKAKEFVDKGAELYVP
jgi:hypothetical protein